ncbi:YoaK family protein [Mycobacterium avium subsp. hominissuis]
MRERFDSETRLSWVLAALAGLVGAVAFTHSAGYFVTFMTGNTERAALGYFRDQPWLALTAVLLLAAFVTGVVVASLCRRHLWVAHPHGPTVLTALSLGAATTVCIATHGWSAAGDLSFVPIPFVAFGIGALNTSFVKDGEVSTPLSYVTGTLVKMGQGIERHISGDSAAAWLGYFLLYISFVVGAIIGGCISLVANGSQMLALATIVCSLTAGYTHFHGDRRVLLKESNSRRQPSRSLLRMIRKKPS